MDTQDRANEDMLRAGGELTADARKWLAELGTTEETKAFRICDESSANWYLSKIANIEAEKERVRTQAAAIVKQLESDRESLEYLYQGELEAFVKSRIEENGGRRKSVHFLQGTCAFRTVPARFAVTDKEAAGLHAAVNTMDEVYVQTFSVEAYRQYAEEWLQKTGELLPGIEQVPARESFSVRFGKKGEEAE
jgi:hypothetical protein